MQILASHMSRFIKLMSLLALLMSTSAQAAHHQHDMKRFEKGNITFTPISHGTFVMQLKQITVYVDPVGKIEDFANFSTPDLILITDIHHDHLAPDLVKALATDNTLVIAPKAVADKLSDVKVKVLNNTETTQFKSLSIEAVAMYNLTQERLKYHKKGRGNGYLIQHQAKRIYISGDTEDVPEMRNLKNIDYAFVCMNLPYTMTAEQAADAVLEMKPKVVFPYHYRGTDGFSDIDKFNALVSRESNVKVKLLKWY